MAAFQLAGCGSREQSAQGYYDSGMRYLDKQEFIKAHVELMNAVQIKENMVEAWRALAKIDEHYKDWPSYAKSLRRIVEFDPKDLETRARLARLYLLFGAADEALTIVNAAVDLAPQNAEVLALKAGVLFRLKDTDGATRAAQEALQLDPGNAEASVVLALPKFLQGNYDDALAYS